jgi:hypothetical protein
VNNVEEDPQIQYYFEEAEDGHIAPVESPTPAVVIPAAPVPAPGGDPDDSGDDSSEDE